jgi:hypothetical protein
MIPNSARLARHATSLVTIVVLAAAAGAFAPRAAHAQDLIPPKTLDRRFPAFQFCPFPLSLSFVADGPMVTIEFKGNVYAADVSGPAYCGQGIDNLAVCATSVYNANSGFPPEFSDASRCYSGLKVGSFFFNRPSLTTQLLEICDTDPTARGWDMSHGAFFDDTRTGPRDPENDLDYSGGSIRLGADNGGTPADTAKTSIAVSGLVSGTSYTLSGWWFVGNIPQDQSTFDPLGNVTLIVRITGTGGTPIARKSWGGLKATYR